jgi:hypothetical protein
VVGRDRIAEDREHAQPGQVGRSAAARRDAVDEGRLGDIGRRGVPGVAVARRDRQGPPAVVAVEHGRVGPAEELRIDRGADDRTDLVGLGPDIGEEDGRAVGARAQRFGRQVDVDAPSQREGDDEGR